MSGAPAIAEARRAEAVFASYVGFTFLAWYLNGLGAVLPPLRDEVGETAGLYALLPGGVLLAWGVATVTRRNPAPHRRDPGIAVGFAILTLSIVVMGITRWPLVSVAGAVIAAVAAGHVNRVLPGMLATARAGVDVEPVMMRANAFSSVASIAAPLVIGASLAAGAGWLPGFALPIAVAAVLVTRSSRRSPGRSPRRSPPGVVEAERAHGAPIPPFREWWREFAVLGLAIVVEFCFSYFAVTFLHEQRGLSNAAAAAGGAAWGVGMAAGRFTYSVRPPPESIVPSAVTILVGFALFRGVPDAAAAIVGLGLAGAGCSPLYPSRITILMNRFPGAPHEGSKRGALAAGSALLTAPALMVALRAVGDVGTAYLAVPVLVVALVGLAAGSRRGARHT